MEPESRRIPPADALRDGLAALALEVPRMGDGGAAARRRSDLVDGALRRLFARYAHPSGGPGAGRLALVALGGYGRRELAPGSDVDLMILHLDRDRELAEQAAAAVLYPLWDLGVGTGHAMRTPDECRMEAAADLRTLTALLDARLLGGPRTLLDDTLSAVRAPLHSRPVEFVAALARSREERGAAFGLLSHSLAPDLKEALGGLRDIHLLGWLASGLLDGDDDPEAGTVPGVPEEPEAPVVLRFPEGPAALEAADLLRPSEAVAVESAWEALVSVRRALHMATGTGSNVLAQDEQAAVADLLGIEAEPAWEPRDALLRDVLRWGRRVDVAVTDALVRAEAAARGRPLSAVALLPDRPFPDGAMETFAAAAEQGLSPDPAALDHFEDGAGAASGAEPSPWSDAMRAAFVRALSAGDPGSRALEAADAVGLLEAALPMWRDVAGRAQRDPYHRFPVDVHLLTAAAAAARLASPGANAIDAETPEALAATRIGDPTALLLGAFLHDAGKVGRGSHVAHGERLAEAALDRMGVRGSSRDDVAFLVREHLLLAEAATRRNIDDEDLVLRVAARVGDERRLAMLWLLTLADAEATGPAASSPWRLGLVRDLMVRVGRAIERGLVDAERTSRLEAAVAATRAELLASGATPDDAAAFLDAIPSGYLLSDPSAHAAADLPLLVPLPHAGEVRVAGPAPGRSEGAYRLSVGTRDRPGLLATVAGAFTLSGLSILAAQAFTTTDGVALDVFDVRGAFEVQVEPDRWDRFRATLSEAVAGDLDLAERVRSLRGHYPAPPEIPVTVQVDADSSDFYSIVEVGATDRLGLLFDLASAFAQQEVDVHVAKVATYGPRVVDVFYVTDLVGRKLEAAGSDVLVAALTTAALA
jgi:[protein-PII] uridylyltransferase